MPNQTLQRACAMCGKMISEQKNQSLIEIDGITYAFDSKDCEIFFKKFKSLYGEMFNPI
ncbi:MAG TPA: hypothetical protein VGA92_03285 [Candidatus Nitrosotenuis sp.]|jgi:YHS domain-containing protein